MRDIELGEVAPPPIPPTSSTPQAALPLSAPALTPAETSRTTSGISPLSTRIAAVSSALAERIVGQVRWRGKASSTAASAAEPSSNPVHPSTGEPHKDDILEYFKTRDRGPGPFGGFGGSRFAFLLWGSEDSERGDTWAVDVPLTDRGPVSEEEAFRKLKARYAELRGVLGSCFYLRSPVVVRPVKFRIVSRSDGKFRVRCRDHDMEDIQRRLERDIKEHQDVLKKHFEVPEGGDDGEMAGMLVMCWISGTRGITTHAGECPLSQLPWDSDNGVPHSGYENVTCPWEDDQRLRDKLDWWKTTSDFTLFFRDPETAKGHKALFGPSKAENLTLSYGELTHHVSTRWDRKGRYAEYDGLFVTDGWTVHRCIYVLVGAAVIVVLASKTLLDTWEAAFSAGSFFLALPMLVLATTSYFK